MRSFLIQKEQSKSKGKSGFWERFLNKKKTCACECVSSLTLTLNQGDNEVGDDAMNAKECLCIHDLEHQNHAAHDDSHSHHPHEHNHPHSHDHNHAHESKGSLLMIGLVLFVLGLFLEHLELPLSYSIWWANGAILAAYLLAGYETILEAIRNIFRGDFFDENFLMTLATFGAIGIGEYPEAAAVMILYQIGEFFQSKAVAKSKGSIAELMDIRPDFANLMLPDGNSQVVKPQELNIGDIILIKSGEKIPVDGVVTQGSSSVDNKALTGESLPVEVQVGDSILSGAINLTGLVQARVEKSFKDSTVSKILELVENASSKKSNQERFITRFSRYYTPVVVVLALALAFLPPLLLHEPVAKWLSRALIFLVISCPCALVISVPLSFFAGIGGASKQGILFKGSVYMEQMAAAKTVMLDKTGTLTKGEFGVVKILPWGQISPDEILELAAYAEMSSNHPIAKSIVQEYHQRTKQSMEASRISALEEISGFGVVATVDGHQVLAGNRKWMEKMDIYVPDDSKEVTEVYVAKDNQYLGLIGVSDKLKVDAPLAIEKLKGAGIKTIILTGDNQRIADKVGQELGVDQVFGELLPQQKVDHVEQAIKEEVASQGKVVFVGDGINDAPVLARADLGIAMGGIGSDAAIEAADVVLMTDEPSKIYQALRISKKTIAIAKSNVIFALGVKSAVMVLGAIGFANMWMAVFADVGVSLIAVLNAMRALHIQEER